MSIDACNLVIIIDLLRILKQRNGGSGSGSGCIVDAVLKAYIQST